MLGHRELIAESLCMEIIHKTPFSTGLLPILDKDGSEGRVALLKATYSIRDDGKLEVSEQQDPVCFTDSFMGEPGVSSTLMESDGAWFKPATDIVVVGSAFAPRGGARTFLASIECGLVSRTAAVFGPRRWFRSSFGGTTISGPEPVSEVTICWERCFGGSNTNGAGAAWEPRNPIGAGYCDGKRGEKLNGLALPNFEDPQCLIGSWNDRPCPQGFGFVGRSWEPRVRYAGTYDENWRKTRMPLPPADFEYRFFNAAPIGMQFPGYVKGGEMVRAINLTRRGLEAFDLPSLHVSFRGMACRTPFETTGAADTVVLDFARMRVVMTYRAKYSVFQNEPADLVRAIVKGSDACL